MKFIFKMFCIHIERRPANVATAKTIAKQFIRPAFHNKQRVSTYFSHRWRWLWENKISLKQKHACLFKTPTLTAICSS